MARQPLLHDHLICLQAPTQAWSAPDGQIRAGTGQIDGVYHGDIRVLSGAVVTVGGEEPEPIARGQRASAGGSRRVRTSALARHLSGPGADPTVRLDREREVAPGRLSERFVLSCATAEPVLTDIEVHLVADLVPMMDVRHGRVIETGVPATVDGDRLRWASDGVEVVLTAPGAELDVTDPTAPRLRWHVRADRAQPVEVAYVLEASDDAAPVGPASGPVWSAPAVTGADDRLTTLLGQGLADLEGLAMSASATPDDVFLAAGTPWFFTLFGRDSIWAARLLLPLGTELAGGTLRTLAALQGTQHVAATAEQPGKIVHEVRRDEAAVDDGTRLPPLYYGTIDATPLWLCLLHDAWRWGMPEAEVEALLPHAERALGWLAESGDADGDGFLEYIDLTGHGLANQGWKDSGDSVRWRDGSLAEGTIALCEVQGYAHEAAIAGASLLDRFGRPGAAGWRDWAGGLRARFREQFWVEDSGGRYPAIALDGEKRPVDTLTSNIGHLPGTGLLDAAEERVVADRLLSPAMSSGFGLRTLARGTGGYWPLSYHGGSVWGHDTAIAVLALVRAGLPEHARRLGRQLLAAAPAFGYRIPELFSGDDSSEVAAPAPYPAACRPQAWTAASAVALLQAELGLVADVPAGTVRTDPDRTRLLEVDGLRLGTQPLRVRSDRPVEPVLP